MKNFISTNTKEVKFCFSLPIGPSNIVQDKNNNILAKLLYYVYHSPAPFQDNEKGCPLITS